MYHIGVVSLTRLRLVRRRKALTQQQLADRAGVNRVTIARLERGHDEPFPTTVRKLSDALGVDPEELMEHLAGDPHVSSLHRDHPSNPHPGAVAPPPRVPTAPDAELGRKVVVADTSGIRRLLSDEPELGVLVREAVDRIVELIPDAQLSLELLVDPDYGESEQLFLGVTTSLQDGDAIEALQRFDREWWVRNARRAHGLLCIDLRDA